MEHLITLRELFRSADAYAGKTLKIGGWVRNRRASKAFGFLMLSDGTYFQPVQVVITDQMENFAEISKINIGAALIVEGTVELTPDAKQPFEIQAKSVVIEGSGAVVGAGAPFEAPQPARTAKSSRPARIRAIFLMLGLD